MAVKDDYVSGDGVTAAQKNNDGDHINDLVVPIGGIIPWAKTLTNVPALSSLYVECNGQVLSDGDSLLDGQTIPDLNGDNQFMRGNSTSGGVGGSETMAHDHTLTTGEPSAKRNAVTGGDPNVGNSLTHTHTGTSSGASEDENRPPFYNVVWVMKVK